MNSLTSCSLPYFKLYILPATSAFCAPVNITLFPFILEPEQHGTRESPDFTGQHGFAPYSWRSDQSVVQASHQGNPLPFHSSFRIYNRYTNAMQIHSQHVQHLGSLVFFNFICYYLLQHTGSKGEGRGSLRRWLPPTAFCRRDL